MRNERGKCFCIWCPEDISICRLQPAAQVRQYPKAEKIYVHERKKDMKKRVASLLLVLCTVLSMIPLQLLAAEADGSADNSVVEISKKAYTLAPDITEYELVTNNQELSRQQVGHVMEVELGGYAEIRVGYSDYNIEAIKSGSNWAMTKPTEQAENAEKRTGLNVVGAVNGDFFNMANGCPSGMTIMQGTVIRDANSSCFWIDEENVAHISASAAAMKEEAAKEGLQVVECIGGGAILLDDGQKTTDGSSYGQIPNPRTVVGIKADGTVIIYMVDGRQAPYSVGMSYGELADIMLELDCVDAINLDGGGSSSFATQREGEEDNDTAGLTMRARPSDGYERKVSTSLLVVSKAQHTGEFDHATISPSQEIYTPGSTITFTAEGVDQGGGAAALPEEGLSWSILEGSDLATMDAQNGELTGKEGATGAVTVALHYNGNQVGTAVIELRWPDKLSFTNNSVSLDFGQTSDLTFNPTYKGRAVHYKDGDFAWTLDSTKTISYKYNLAVEQYYHPKWPAGYKQIYLSLTGSGRATGNYSNDSYAFYETEYSETFTVSVQEDGNIQVNADLVHENSVLRKTTGEIFDDHLTEDMAAIGQEVGGVQGLQAGRQASFSVGKFSNNTYTADEDNSLRATIQVALKHDATVTGEIDVAVGMEPLILFDFEAKDGQTAEEYWNTYLNHKGNGITSDGQLALVTVQEYRLWMRDIGPKGVTFYGSGIVSADENAENYDSRVRFGENAFELAYDFTGVKESDVAVANFGYTCDLYVDTAQPTKIGLWINVPEECKGDTSVLKVIMAAGATEQGASSLAGYNKLEANGTITFHQGNTMPKGTSTYCQYYGYDENGNVLQTLDDFAGKGWMWVEADVSSLQMPIDVYRGYTVRVVSAQNNVKRAGSILIDNIQFIYGTNTNDVNKPEITGITELNSQTQLTEETAAIGNGSVSFEVLYSDHELTDKFATGIDVGSIHVYVDGREYTRDCTINAGNLITPSLTLTNGSHTIKVSVKDYYGNLTEVVRSFTVNDAVGTDAVVGVAPQEAAPAIGGIYQLNIINKDTMPVESADVSIWLPKSYLQGAQVSGGSGYTATQTLDEEQQLVKIHVAMDQQASEYGDVLATLTVTIPEDAQKGDVFRYSVPQGAYATAAGTATFSEPEKSVALAAAYAVEAGQSIVGFDTEFTVTDPSGEAAAGVGVYCGEDLLGTTDANGVVSYKFTQAGRKTIYAKDSSGGRSWNGAVVVCQPATDGNGMPFGVQNTATQNADTTRSITWMSAIAYSQDQALIRYATDQNAVADAQTVAGTSQLLAFAQSEAGDAMRINAVKLTGLQPDTTYYYQVGDGEKWSEVYSFTTASGDPQGDTNFFVIGDIQSNDTAALVAALEQIRNSGIAYSFGLQTGDAIDDVTRFSNWRSLMTVLNAQTLNGVDLVHTLGNHEYYGDADGSIAGTVFQTPASQPNSWYSVEYGCVYVAVVNNGADMLSALEALKADAAQSSCQWKVLVVHEPIFGTNGEMDAEARKQLTDAIEDAGIEFVFTGDDHAYARTYPMLDGVAQDAQSTEGVVYFVSGDLSSKGNAFKKYDYFAEAIPHIEYQGMYISVQATRSAFTVTAYDYQGNLLDSYTKNRTDCQLGNHKADANSRYNMAQGTITCSVCGQAVDAEAVGYSGLLNTTDGKQIILTGGVPVKDKFTPMGADVYHSDGQGYAQKAVVGTNVTCTKGGYTTYTCETCQVSQTVGDFIMPGGHTWDEDHVCTVCEFHGISLEGATVNFGTVDNPREGTTIPYYVLEEKGVRPYTYVTFDGKTALTKSNDASLNADGTMRDLYISWDNDRSVGVATVRYEGRGDYYGVRELQYKLLPGSVTDLKAAATGTNSVTLTWDAAIGAGYYRVYRCDANGTTIEKLTETEATRYTVTGLNRDTEYYFKVAASTVVDGERYDSSKWSNILAATTGTAGESEALITGISADVGGYTVDAAMDETGRYLFLPASVDLTEVALSFETEGVTDAITLQGQKGSVTIGYSSGAHAQSVDLTALTDKDSDGRYLLEVAMGNNAPFTLVIMQGSQIPSIYLTSDDPAYGRDYIEAIKGNEATAQMQMIAADGSSIYQGALTEIKARGNSTFTYYDKKAYQIKLAEKTDLLGTGENVKTWVLLANYADATGMHDKFFKDLATQMQLDYTAQTGWVNLYYDGEYRGLYELSEKNSVGGTSVDITDLEEAYQALNPSYGEDMNTATGTNAYGQTIQFTTGLKDPADITGGYLIELNHDYWDEASGFATKQGVAFNVKSPEWASEAAIRYISEYYQGFEDAVYAVDADGNYTGYNEATGKYYYDYVDQESLVKLVLLQQLALNPDGFISSVYFYKDVGGKMYAGPIWDQDMTLGTGWSKYIDPSIVDYHYLEEALLRIPGFKKAVTDYYHSVFAPMVAETIADGGTVDQYADVLAENMAMNHVLWPFIRIGSPSASGHVWENTTYDEVIRDTKQWLADRLEVLDGIFVASGDVTGDVNGDGKADSDDAVLILRHLAGYEVTGNIAAGDVNGDGRADSDDAVLILRRLAGYVD